VLRFVKRDGTIWELTNDQVKTWQRVYDGVDVVVECRHAWAWHDANPSKRKKNVKAFLVNWLNGAAPTKRVRADRYGHVPPCESWAACVERVCAEARAKKESGR
jgi:hypothetical protein